MNKVFRDHWAFIFRKSNAELSDSNVTFIHKRNKPGLIWGMIKCSVTEAKVEK